MTRSSSARRPSRGLRFEPLETRVLLAGDLYRAITGDGNNLANPQWGAVDTQLVRLMTADYSDGKSAPSGASRPSARVVSNTVVAQSSDVINDRQLTDFVWAWGQFVDHDLDLTEPAEPHESFPIAVPTGDPHFDPYGSGGVEIDLSRSVYDTNTGITDARQQINQITAYIDASNVYGSDEVRANALRTFVAGKLKTSANDLLPYNDDGLPNAMSTSSVFFLGGDVRANENTMLTSLHTVFVREHNRLADGIAASDFTGADLTDAAVDEEIYQRARQIVGAQLQAITYYEFLPALLGYGQVPSYSESGGYDADVSAGISNEFSTAAFRVGHTMLSSDLQLRDAAGTDLGTLSLANAFFNPSYIEQNGIDQLLQGAASQKMQEIDSLVIDDVRNFLFGPPGAGGFDLASLNIQRGRDHALPSYNAARAALGLGAVSTFAEISSDPNVVANLQTAYGTVDEIDFWVGGLAEDHLPGRSLGALFSVVIEDQFHRLRAGDRYYYEFALDAEMVADVSNTRLADIIQRNSAVANLQTNVFLDQSVFYFRPPADAANMQWRLDVEGGQLRMRDANDVVVAQQSLATVEAVVVEGPVDGASVTLHLDVQDLPATPITIADFDTLSLDRLMPTDEVVLGQQELLLNGQSIATIDVDQIVAEGRRPVDQLIGVLGNGVSVRDDATGTGYVMYSVGGLSDRFANMAPNAEQLVVVVHQNNQWHYDNNLELVPFQPDPRDVLIAEVDFDAQSIDALEGVVKSVHGIRAGYVEGDLSFAPDFLSSNGDIDVSGMLFRTLTPATRHDLGEIRMGIAANDYATGEAHVMYSAEGVFSRFAAMPPPAANSEHLIIVRYSNGQWFYDASSTEVPFTPRPSDVILADISYSNDAIVSLQGAVGHRHDITAGFSEGDLRFFANRWGNAYNEGEFRVEGSYFETLAAPKAFVELDGVSGAIAARDTAQGEGYIMYSQEPVESRMALTGGGSQHFVIVVHQAGQWHYDTNGKLAPFEPLGTDLLVAKVDLGADTVEPLSDRLGQVHGIPSGYTGGDLAFFANQFGGNPNAGEFDVTGSYFERELPRDVVTYSIDDAGPGIAARDNATGQGYLMYSRQALSTRFSQLLSGVSEHFIAVVHDGDGWHYDSNGGLEPFTPESDDVLLAKVDFGADTIAPLTGRLGVVHGVQSGYVDGDLEFFANQYGGDANGGEFQITGSYFRTLAATEFRDLGVVAAGIAAADNGVGIGYVLHSEENVFDRFDSPPVAGSSQHLIAAVHLNGQWHFDNNGSLQAFTPRPSDVLLAEINYDADTIQPLQNKFGDHYGIRSGYSEGDLTFTANQWGGKSNAGEFTVAGSFFRSLKVANAGVVAVGALNGGVAAADSAAGVGYLMYTELPAVHRFGSATGGAAEHLVAVRQVNGQWHYDNNGSLLPLTPYSSDVLLAKFVYGSGTVESLQGQLGHLDGIDYGYRSGDLTFIAERFGNSPNPGEFHVTGTFFSR